MMEERGRSQEAATTSVHGTPRDEVRVKPFDPAATAPPVELSRLRSGPQLDGLVPAEDDQPDAALRMPEGLEGAAERHLARADAAAAVAVAAVLSAGDDGDVPAESLTDEHVAGRTVKARALLMEGRIDEARTALGPARDDPRFALADAALSMAEGDLERAQSRVQQALSRRQHGIAEVYTFAMLLVVAGEIEEAVPLLVEVCASLPGHAVARHQLGRVMLAEGDPARAGTLFETAYELAPSFSAPAMTLAEMFVDAHQYGEAMNLLADVTDRLPHLIAPRLLQLRILIEARRPPAAMQLAEALRQVAPQREDVMVLWGEALVLNNRASEATGPLEQLVRSGTADPVRVLRLLTRVAISSEPPQLDAAVRYMQDAIRANPTSGELILELAQMQFGLGQAEEAAATLESLAGKEDIELGVVLSAAVLAGKQGYRSIGKKLAESAASRVVGTPAEAQVRSLMRTFEQGA